MSIRRAPQRNIQTSPQSPLFVRKSIRKNKLMRAALLVASFGIFVSISSLAFFVVQGKKIVHTEVVAPQEEVVLQESIILNAKQFPVGVDPLHKVIVEDPIVESYFEEHVAINKTSPQTHTSWLSKAMGKLVLMSWYQNLASISSRILIIQPGERKEQVAEHFAKILGWTKEQKAEFLKGIESTEPVLTDGKFFPGSYTVARKSLPEVVIPLVTDRFESEVLARYGSDVEDIVPLADTLTIASLLEREAYDFEDMRLIAGVIWNRLFIDMNLQIDATLQYARGSEPSEPWWPRVVPDDKYIASVYNTYKNSGLPPAPIANPSLESILAALNPRKTDCMYYFHDTHAEFHCSKTYAEHVASLKQYYGRGK
ncbi:MAG: endolytic transglycosylase MltG [Minisyncoccia bacterium]